MHAHNKKHVLLCCYYFEFGGNSTHTVSIGGALRRRGYKVGALVQEPFGECYGDFVTQLDYVEIIRRGLETRTQYLQRMVQRINSLQPSIIINSNVHFVQAALPFLSDDCIRISAMHSIMKCELALCTSNCQFLDHIVTVSDNAKSLLERAGQGGDRIRTIPVAIEMNAGIVPREKPQLPLRLISVGRLSPEKDLAGIVSILKLLAAGSVPFSISIVGTGPDLQSIRSKVETSPFRRQVRFLGFRTQKEIRPLLQESDFFLLTSHYEGTPHAVLEAMAEGAVVLANRIPGSTDKIITDGVDGFLCDRQRPETYVSVLQRLLVQPSEFRAVSLAAQKVARSRYSLEAVVPQYEALFWRRRPPVKKPAQRASLPPELLPFCPGFLRQCAHRLGDLWRRCATNKRTVI